MQEKISGKHWLQIGPGILLLIGMIGMSCTARTSPVTPTAMTVTPPPVSTPTPLPTFTPTAKPLPSSTPTVTATPVPPVEGYWIQTTRRNGLCSDSPRFLGFGESYYRPYLAGDGGTFCFYDLYSLKRWYGEFPSPAFGPAHWFSYKIPGLSRLMGAADYPVEMGYGLPTLVGTGGRCILPVEGFGPVPQWECTTAADGNVPFDDIRGYALIEDTTVEWFMSATEVASRGRKPQDQRYDLAAWIGAPDVQLTWLAAASYWMKAGIWVGTAKHGVVKIDPNTETLTRYTRANGLPGDEVRDLFICGNTCLWVATSTGVGHWDGKNWTSYTEADGLPSADIRGISSSRGPQGIWAATAAGPAFLPENATQWQSVAGLPQDVVLTGVFWNSFSSKGSGLWQFEELPVIHGRWEVFTTAQGLPSDRIVGLAATEQGIVVGTAQGAVEWNGTAWIPITRAAINDVAGTLLGTGQGLWVRKAAGWKSVTREPVLHVAENGWYATARQVCRWTGTESRCIKTVDGKTLRGIQALVPTAQDGISVIDGTGQIWNYQETECDGGCFTKGIVLTSELSSYPTVNDAIAFSDGSWWAATDLGIYREWEIGIDLEGDSSVKTRRLIADGQRIWEMTDQGIFLAEFKDTPSADGNFAHYYLGDLPVRDFQTVLPMPNGSLWIGSTDHGLFHYFPSENITHR